MRVCGVTRATASHHAREHAGRAAILASSAAHFEAALAAAAHDHVVQRTPRARCALRRPWSVRAALTQFANQQYWAIIGSTEFHKNSLCFRGHVESYGWQMTAENPASSSVTPVRRQQAEYRWLRAAH